MQTLLKTNNLHIQLLSNTKFTVRSHLLNEVIIMRMILQFVVVFIV